MSLLDVIELQTHFFTPNGVVKSVNGVRFSIDHGEIMALVGESGSGKSITGLSILGLVPKPNGKIVGGKIIFDGQDLVSMSEKQLCGIRGEEIAMIFQNPLTALDPSFKIVDQITEIIRFREKIDKNGARKEAEALMDLVGIHDPKRVLDCYPHALSGGMRQRVMIAMALSCKPKLLIADEPTTALDATIQKQILTLLKKINEELKTAILMITHDFGVVASLCDSVAVMYAGRIVEYGKTADILSHPEHPYTRGLIDSMPNLIRNNEMKRLKQIEGTPPDLLHLPVGCSFYDRCSEAENKCIEAFPDQTFVDEKHFVRCFNREGVINDASGRT
jgi:oligopeptide/dipeptide ABC transporter ATP-binding protein